MAITINTNKKASVARAAVAQNSRHLGTAMEQLSTGKKINSASDNAAGLAISTRMTSNIIQLQLGIRNANDAVGMIQTADSAMDAATDMLQRMRELAVQAASGTASATDRSYLNQEYMALAAEISRLGASTTFNGKQLLDGTLEDTISFVTSSISDPLTISFRQLATTAVPYGDVWNGDNYGPVANGEPALLIQNVAGSGLSVSTFVFLGDGNPYKVDDIISFRAEGNTYFLKVTSVVEPDPIAGYGSGITSVTTLVDEEISQKFGSGGTPFTNETIAEGASFEIKSIDNFEMRVGGSGGATWRNHLVMLKTGTGTFDFQMVESSTHGASMGYSTTSRGLIAASYHADILNVQGAYNALEALDHDLNAVSAERAKYGAAINNIAYSIENMQNEVINQAGSRSRFLNTDYATTSASLARTQIIQQASMAMISQANALPETVMMLLRD